MTISCKKSTKYLNKCFVCLKVIYLYKILKFLKETYNGLLSLRYLDLVNNKLEQFDKETLAGLANLTHIRLSHNNLEQIDKETFSGLVSLKDLELSFNHLQKLDGDTFKGKNKIFKYIKCQMSYN